MSPVRSRWLANLPLKLLALSLAVLLHLVVRHDTVRELSMRVSVGLTAVPEGRIFTGQLPDAVEVQVRGRWSVLRELLADPARRVACDLSNYRDGERYVFDLRAVAQQLGAGDLEVTAIRPSAFEVRLDSVATRKVPVQVSTTGEPVAGYAVVPAGIRVEPQSVEVQGPASEVREVRAIRAMPIDLEGAASNFRVRARLLPVGGGQIRLAAEEVDVVVRVDQLEVTRTLDAVRVVVRGCPESVRCVVEPSHVEVTLRGRIRAVQAALDQAPDDLAAVDVAGAIAAGKRTARVVVRSIAEVAVSARPTIANFQVLGEIPADPRPEP